ncbi:MAG: heavy-metal-associated domain-containing protein [Flavobacteriaceae bacterium]
MKSSILVLVLSLFTFACTQQSKPEIKVVEAKTEVSMISENLAVASFSISGMTCKMGCAATIEKNLNKLDGVQKAEVDFETEMAMVHYDPNIVGEEGLTEAVAKTGSAYKVSGFTLADNEKKACCKEGKKSCDADEKKACCMKDKKACCKKGEDGKCMKKA